MLLSIHVCEAILAGGAAELNLVELKHDVEGRDLLLIDGTGAHPAFGDCTTWQIGAFTAI